MIPCKKCMLEDIDFDGIYAHITQLIELIPEEERTAEAEYRRRLDICRQCECLHSGTCEKCGCYVELRAARSKMDCPHEDKRWK